MEQKNSRRQRGTGNIYQRPDKSWIGRLVVGKNENGTPKKKYFSGKTEAEVKKKILAYLKSNSGIDATKTTLEDYVTNWLKNYKAVELKKSSYDRLESTVRNHVIPNFGLLQMSEITSDDIQPYFKRMQEKDVSFSTVKKVYDCLNEMFRFATIKQDIVRNPMLTVTKPKAEKFQKNEIRYFTEAEMNLIAEECRREYSTGKLVYPYGYGFIFLQNTGLRMGELIGLKKTDIDLDKKIAHISGNMQAVRKRDSDGELLTGKEMVMNSTKTYSGDRYIPLNETALEAVKRLMKESECEFLLSTNTGKPVPPDRLERSFYRLLKNVGIEQTGLHTLRHSFASMLFAKGTDVKTVSTLLGHASITITMNTYIHLIEKQDHSAVQKLDASTNY